MNFVKLRKAMFIFSFEKIEKHLPLLLLLLAPRKTLLSISISISNFDFNHPIIN